MVDARPSRRWLHQSQRTLKLLVLGQAKHYMMRDQGLTSHQAPLCLGSVVGSSPGALTGELECNSKSQCDGRCKTLASPKPTYTQAIGFRTSQALHDEGSRLDVTPVVGSSPGALTGELECNSKSQCDGRCKADKGNCFERHTSLEAIPFVGLASTITL
jgi:hypothetical protein